MINCTGVILAIYKNNVFETLEPIGPSASLIELKSDPYIIDGVAFRDLTISGIRNLPESNGEFIIVDKPVALYGWSIGRYDLIYLDGHMVQDKDGKIVASQTLVKFNG